MKLVRYSHTVKWQKYGVFRCRCGKEFVARISAVKYGNTKSCGCLSGEKHGLRRSPEYTAWVHMRQRCNNPSDHAYADYGGRGVRVAALWNQSFTAFLRDVGQRPTPAHSIDRIDNNGHYKPGNVRWATKKQQANNRRRRSCWKKSA